MPLNISLIFRFHLQISDDGQNDQEEPDVHKHEKKVMKDRPAESNLEETIETVSDDAQVCFIL